MISPLEATFVTITRALVSTSGEGGKLSFDLGTLPYRIASSESTHFAEGYSDIAECAVRNYFYIEKGQNVQYVCIKTDVKLCYVDCFSLHFPLILEIVYY